MFSFFSHIAHAVASFIVASLIGAGLAAAPVATTTPTFQSDTAVEATAISTSTQSSPITTSSLATTNNSSKSQINKSNVDSSQKTQEKSSNTTVVVINTTAGSSNASTTNEIPSSGPTTVTIKADTLGITSDGMQAFYNISSDSNSEVDVKTIRASVTGVETTGGMVLSISDDTDNQLLVASTQDAYFDSNATLQINATLNKPLVIRSGYPTLFDIKVTNLYPLKNNPAITLSSIGSDFISNLGGTIVLKNTLESDSEDYYILKNSCVGLQGDAYSDCLNYALNH
ncbi:MAG TPA: hypothetical protein VG753_02520 [Candidatus Paceibacterota bacterium]|nr:hypothetical protein [Candidatus Paceibacterota bacterium]